MKMVCKKLLSLVLVALMLVSAVPFQASAAGSVEVPVTVYINDEAVNTSKTLKVDGSGVVLDESLAMSMLKNTENRTFVKWMNGSGEVVTGKSLSSDWVDSHPGYALSLYLSETKPTNPTNPTETNPTNPTETNPTEPKPTEHVHNYVEKERVEPTCGKDGYIVKKCDCGSEVKEVLKATGNHTWGGWVIQNEATATTEGTMIRTCSTCGQTETQKYTAKTKEISFQVTLDGETTTTKSVFVLDKTMSLPKPSVPSGYQFKGWFTEPNGKGAQLNDGTTCTENLANVYYGYFTKVSKFPYSVYLHIYETGNVKTPMKTVTLDTWTCVKDGVVTLDEIKEVVKTYYTAKTSDGIAYDGIYYSTSSTKTDYVNDQNKTDRINNLDELRRDGYVHLNVWVDNVKAKSDSNSNTSSNPKTGDTIYMAVTVMGLSAASLAAVYYISKKRAVR